MLLSCALCENCVLQTNKCFNEIIEVLLAMLQRDVPDNCRQSQQYFHVLHVYVQMVSCRTKLRSHYISELFLELPVVSDCYTTIHRV